jgi:3-methyladenine DNA glycosylase AlkD
VATPARAVVSRRYFRTGPGEYGEGDRFLGVAVPDLRHIARGCRALSPASVRRLLESDWHEERLLALLILVDQYARGDALRREAIFRLYRRHADRVNNWDLVDLSAPQILGVHLEDRDRSLLVRLAASPSVWERRMAIVATAPYIRESQFHDTLFIARRLLGDPHDLIHKAVGWMLREVAKRDRAVVERFLARHGRRMPRTMLRYAIERFPPVLRRRYLASPVARRRHRR